MRYALISLLTGVLLSSVSPAVAQAEFSVSPLLVDESLKPRDIVTVPVTISNSVDRRYRLYATVNAIDIGAGGEIREFISPSMDDRSTSITSWIEVSRGRIDLPPEGTTEVPVTVKVNPFAEPGEYHAFIGFVAASKRHEAEAAARAGEAQGMVLRIEVPEDRQTLLRLDQFSISRFVSRPGDREVAYRVENPGDTPVAPRGEIIYYDARGQEVAAVPLNEAGRTIDPGETLALSAPVPVDGLFGRYKALINLQYGQTQVASINDTAFFYLLPLHLLILLLGALAVLGAVLVLVLRRTLGDADDDDDDRGDDVPLFVRSGSSASTHDHDVSLK